MVAATTELDEHDDGFNLQAKASTPAWRAAALVASLCGVMMANMWANPVVTLSVLCRPWPSPRFPLVPVWTPRDGVVDTIELSGRRPRQSTETGWATGPRLLKTRLVQSVLTRISSKQDDVY